MIDPRIDKLARILVNYSLRLKDGDLFLIQGSDVTAPLIRSVYYEALLAGAHPFLKVHVDGVAEILYKTASDDQLTYISDLQKLEVEKTDAALTILGTYNTRNLSNVNPDRIALQKRAGIKLTQRMLERISKGELRWCGTQFPTQASAQDAEMSLADYGEFLFAACKVDAEDPIGYWQKLHADQNRIIKFLSQCKSLHVKSGDTDLQLNVEGRRWVNCSGHENFPDGEIFTSPLEDSVNGHIHFSYPAVYQNREVEDVRLTFENGQVIRVEAGKGLDFLKAMLETDDGAKFVGEFAFGTNEGITRFTRNTLFDEKIGGTVHLALGTSLPESSGKNVSAIHWDMVCDLRSASEVLADGEVFYENGKFLI
jgi:aminopeptidase